MTAVPPRMVMSRLGMSEAYERASVWGTDRGLILVHPRVEARQDVPMVSVVVADDQALLREGFRALLDADPAIEVVAEAADGREAVAAVGRTAPDVVLMDIRMPVLD